MPKLKTIAEHQAVLDALELRIWKQHEILDKLNCRFGYLQYQIGMAIQNERDSFVEKRRKSK